MSDDISTVRKFVLFLHSTKLTSLAQGVLHFRVQLDAHVPVADRPLLDGALEVLKKGMSVYTTDDLNTEITRLLREELVRTQEENKELTRKLMVADLKLKAYQVGVLPEDLVK